MKKLILISITTLSFKASVSMEFVKKNLHTNRDAFNTKIINFVKKTAPTINASIPNNDEVAKEIDASIIQKSKDIARPYAGAIGNMVVQYKNNNNLNIKDAIIDATKKPRLYAPLVAVVYVTSKYLNEKLD